MTDVVNPIKLTVLPLKPGTDNAQFLSLPHPRAGTCLFLTNGNDLFQLQKFENQFNSLAIDDYITKEGSITTATLFDPLFIWIPVLEKSTMFKSLSDICYEFESHSNQLISLSKLPLDLSIICDLVQNDDEFYVKLNKQKLLAWLVKKVNYLVSVIDNLELFASYKFSTTNDRVSVAIRIISDNLSQEWTNLLMQEFKLDNLKGESVNYFEDQIKRTAKEEPVKKKEVKKVKKAPINTSGMRKMTDFFKKKEP